MSLSDLSHLDPCRFCRGLFLRADLIRAAAVLGAGKRGYVCQGCLERKSRLGVIR